MKFTAEETAFQQATADRLSISLAEFRKLALIAATQAVAARLDAGSQIELPLELEPKGGQLIPFPDDRHRESIAREFIPPAQMAKAQKLAEKGEWSLNAIGQFALAFGLKHLEENGAEILSLPPLRY